MNINLINFWKFARPFILGLAVIFLGYLAQTVSLPLVYGEEGSEPPVFCPTGQLISSIPECQGQQQCTRDYIYGDSCQSVKDKLYGCKYVYGKCGYYGSTTPSQPTQPAAPAPTNESCANLVTNRICGGQPAYDDCSTVRYDGNRAYYYCEASKNRNCQGKIYCGLYDKPFAQVPVYPSNVDSSGQVMAPTCDSVATTTNYCPGVETYDTCTLRYVGNKAYYDCKASQNPNCQGTKACPAKNKTTTTTTQPEQPTQQIVNCPDGTVPQSGTQNQNTIVCVAQNNDQRTDQNNNQAQSNSQNVSVSSSSSATGGSANVNVTGVQTFGNVGVERVVTAQAPAVAGVKELPKTGLPLLAWAALAFIPAGFKIRGFNKVKEQTSAKPHFLWEDRQFKADLDN